MNGNYPVPVFVPSLRDICPRAGCGMQMSSHQEEDFLVIQCATCGYSVKEISGELKARYREELFVRTAQRRMNEAPRRQG